MRANSHIAHVPGSSNQKWPLVEDGPRDWLEEECGCEPVVHSSACVREQTRIQHARYAGLCAWCDEPLFHNEFCRDWCREQAHCDYLDRIPA
jgi:hypothetical protein